MSLVACGASKLALGVFEPGFRGKTYDWRAAPGSEANTAGVRAGLAVMDLGNALEQTWNTDAHLVTYILRENGTPLLHQPRLNKPCLEWIRAQGFEVSVDVFFADVDNPGHAPWTPELRAELEQIIRRSETIATAGIYLTAHGYRVMQPLARGLPPENAEAARLAWMLALDGDGIRVDHACASWNWAFRLPRVRRDGRAQKSELLLERMRPVDPPAVKAQARAGRAGRGKPRRPDGVDVVRELPAAWAERIGPIAAALAAGDYRGHRHEVALELAGALLGRRVPAEYVPAFVEAATRAAGWDAAHHGKSAEDTMHKWAAGAAVRGVRALGQRAPAVLEALELELDAGAQRAAAQAAPEVVEQLDDVTARLEELLGDVPAGLLLVKAQCGLGKTRAAIVAAAKRAHVAHRTPGEHKRAPLHSKTAIAVPTTKLARELADKIADQGETVVRFFGVLSVVKNDGSPECQFHAAGRMLAAGGQSIPWEFCEGRGKDKCDVTETCPAYGGRIGPKEARIAVGPHSMLAELDGWAGTTGLLVIDEPPELLVTEVLRVEDLAVALASLIRFDPRYAAAMAPAVHAVHAWLRDGGELDYVGSLEKAFAWGVDRDLEDAAFAATGATSATEAARNAFKPDHTGSCAPPLKRWEVLAARKAPGYAAALGEASRVVGALWRCLNVDGAVVRVEARGVLEDGSPRPALVCTWPDDQLRAALRRDGAVAVLDAGADLHAPVMAKVVGYEPPMHTFAAPDGAPVERVLLRTSSATRAGWMPRGRLEVARVTVAVRAAVGWLLERPGPAGVITFIAVELALRAARGEDVRTAWTRAGQSARELELVRAALGPELERLGGERLELGHYGAMRGLDGWKDLDALVTLGDPWRNLGDVQHEVDYLGLAGGWEARVEAQARAELEQAHGRLRTVHRTREARQLHVGAVVPGGWPSWATRRPPEGRPVSVAALAPEELAALVGRCGGVGRAASAVGVERQTMHRYLNGARGVPPDVVAGLRALVASQGTSAGVTESPIKDSSNRGFGDMATYGHEPSANRPFGYIEGQNDADDGPEDDGPPGGEHATVPPSSAVGPRRGDGVCGRAVAPRAPWERAQGRAWRDAA